MSNAFAQELLATEERGGCVVQPSAVPSRNEKPRLQSLKSRFEEYRATCGILSLRSGQALKAVSLKSIRQ